MLNILKVQQNESFFVKSGENLTINFYCHSFAFLHTYKILSAQW